jgi:type VI secretion system secreted protein VgrG
MTLSLTQDNRISSLECRLGKDVLVAVRFDGTEGVSELFEYTIEALSEKSDIDFDKAIGTHCAIIFKTHEKPERVFNGVLVAAQGIGGEADLYNYRLVLRPWLWLLSQTSDCRIFEHETAPDIIKKVFTDRGFSDFRDSTTGDFPELEYCVQYRETDLAFVARLMEQHGIYYFFEHAKDKHVLVLANAKSSHRRVPGHGEVPVFLAERQDRRDQEHLFRWSSKRSFRSGKVALTDYDYLQPDANMKGDAEASANYTKSKMEIFDYPGKYKKPKDGETYAKVRLQAEQAADHRRHAEGDAVSLFPGGLVKLAKHPQGSENKEYLILAATHSYMSEAYYSGMGGGEARYFGTYELLPSDINYRAPLTTPRPIVYGPQTAKVVGKEGEEIDVDDHGRILVRFFWDRKQKQSCRVRVAQVWAGSGWGGQVIPRIGQEVIVEFLEGDPDRPLVTGTVFNGNNKYPFEMPANKTQSGLKSASTKGQAGYNEFMFEDKKGSEKIRMHAEKDHEVVIRHAETTEIGENFGSGTSRKTTLKKGTDELWIERGNQKVDIKGKQDIDVLETISMTAKQKITLTVGASTITLEPAQITINAPLVNVQSTMKTDISGGMTINMAAGIIKIN